jgi:hypothetical protein
MSFLFFGFRKRQNLSWHAHMGEMMKKDGKRWEKNVGKIRNICQNEEMIGKRYQ